MRIFFGAPVDVDPGDAISQLSKTFTDVLPFVLLVICFAVAMRYMKKWMLEEEYSDDPYSGTENPEESYRVEGHTWECDCPECQSLWYSSQEADLSSHDNEWMEAEMHDQYWSDPLAWESGGEMTIGEIDEIRARERQQSEPIFRVP